MNIDDLSEMAATLFAISLASERIVTIAKTAFPVWLANEKKTGAQEVDLVADKGRRLLILAIAFVSACFTASFLVDSDWGLDDLYGTIVIGSDRAKGLHLNVLLVGLLASGGSSLWSNLLGYTKAVKEVQTQRKASEGLSYRQKASKEGLTTFDSGNAARRPLDRTVMDRMSTLAPPQFDLELSRI
ncbi:hypothetical protein IC229_25600 [Spirosoma sp. BT702]|uniref:Uncharacterized protein n=1 Tax=Spirosoma profusum TaxID=2771354 RepID=A0A926Y551_9BACT|nr:hypothetical protein [Spirosoma profusum]MBD2704046.1 hypothetical protein [Spirosoma profusum]